LIFYQKIVNLSTCMISVSGRESWWNKNKPPDGTLREQTPQMVSPLFTFGCADVLINPHKNYYGASEPFACKRDS